MADALIKLPDDSINTGPKLDTSSLTVSAQTVHRERMNIADPTSDVALAAVTNSAPTTQYGLVVRTAGNVLARQNDGTNSETTLFDADTGAGTQYLQGVILRKSASGGSVEAGTATDPLRIDPTGSTTQPVSLASTTITGTVAVTQSGTWDEVGINDSGNSITVDNSTLSVVGGGVEATALRVTLASDSTGLISVDDNGGSLTVDGTVSVSGAVDTELTTADVDTGAGTDTRAVVGLVGTASGGGQLIPGSSTDGLLVNLGANNDITLASTTITGTVAVTQSGTWDEVGINDSGNAITVDWAGTAPPIGAGVEATALRVTIATDSTGVLSVDDNSGSLTVDGVTRTEYTVDAAAPASPVGDAPLAERDDQLAALTEIEGDWTNLRASSKGALWVTIPDSNGDPITSFGGGTQYTEDVAAAADPIGTVPILVRDDAPAAITSTDGDNIAQRGTNYGAAYVQVVTSSGSFVDTFGGSGGTAQADESGFTEGTTSMTPIGGVLNDTITSDPTEDQAAAVRITAKRAFHTNLRKADGTEISSGGGVEADALRVTIASDSTGLLSVDDNGGSLTVDNAALSVTGGGVEASALRVTIASDSTGVLSVDDNGGALTVDGTVSVSGAVDTELTTADLDTGAGTDTRAVVGLVGTASGGGQLIPGSSTDGLLVNLGANNDVTLASTTITGTVAVTQSGTWDEVGINDSGNSITVDNAALSVTGGGVEATALRVTIASDSTGVLSVDDNGSTLSVDGTVAVSSITTSVTPGTAAANLGKAEDAVHASGDVGVMALGVRDDVPAAISGTDGDYETFHVSAEGGVWVSPTPSASGGLTIFRSLDLDETEEEVKATAGCVYTLWFTNTATSTLWLKFYNATAATVVVGTTTPVMTIGLPGNTSDDISGMFSSSHGLAFGTAITVAATTGVADSDTGAPAANNVIINIGYK